MKTPWDLFETDPELETSGVWLNYGAFKIRIARMGGANLKWAAVYEEKTRPYRRGLEYLPEDKSRRILAECMGEALVTGWEPFVDRDGTTLDFNVPNVVRVLEQLPNLMLSLQAEGQKLENFLRGKREDELKN